MWQLGQDEAVFTGSELSLSLAPSDPVAGGRLAFNGAASVADPLWSWAPVGHVAPKLSEAYTRGADLVLLYGPGEGFPFHTDAYWRCESSSDAVVVSLTLSVRTHKLDTHPVYEVGSTLNTPGLTELSAGGIVGRLAAAADGGWSLVETPYPGDMNPLPPAPGTDAEGAVGTRWRLFDLFMEKGVIRRSRISLAITPSELTADAALALACRLRAEPVALST